MLILVKIKVERKRHIPISAPVAHFGSRLELRLITDKASRANEYKGSASHTLPYGGEEGFIIPI